MEKNISAVFYDFKYYILPEDFADLNSIKDGDVIKAKRLKEERCMAPDFIYESIAEEQLTVEKRELLFPVTVDLYSGEEYDKLLSKQVDKVCHGCLRFIDNDDPSLDGHHREISLEGVCYEREEDDGEFSYSLRVYYFYEVLAKRLNELADCIEKGNQKKFNKICQSCASRYISAPVRFCGGKKDGKYCLYMQAGFGHDLYYALLTYAAYVAEQEGNPLYKAGWTVVPYVPKDIERYRGKIKDNTPIGRLKDSKAAPRWLDLDIYLKNPSEKKRTKLIWDLHTYLSYKAGENAVLRTVDAYDVTKDKDGLLTAAEIAEKILEKDGQFEETNSFPLSYPLNWQGEKNALPHKRSAEGFTVCYSLSSIGADSGYAKKFAFDDGYSYAYVFVPCNDTNYEAVLRIVQYYLGGEKRVPEPILLKEFYEVSYMPCGLFVCSDDAGSVNGVALDFLVTNEKAFYRFLKILSPVMTYYGATLVVVNDGGVSEYSLGYKITPLGGGVNN